MLLVLDRFLWLPVWGGAADSGSLRNIVNTEPDASKLMPKVWDRSQ
jgi:hypothetical protein